MHTGQRTQQLALCCCSLWQHSFPLLDGVHRCWVGQQTSSLRAHQRETVIRDCLCLILSFTLLPFKDLGQFLRWFMADYPHMDLIFIWDHSFIKQYSLCLLAKTHISKQRIQIQQILWYGYAKTKCNTIQNKLHNLQTFEVNIAFLAIEWLKVKMRTKIELLNTYEPTIHAIKQQQENSQKAFSSVGVLRLLGYCSNMVDLFLCRFKGLIQSY